MTEAIKKFFQKEKIEYYAVLDYADLKQTNGDILARYELKPMSAIIYLVPYFVEDGINLSAYATSRDYHLYVRELGEGLKKEILSLFPDAKCVAFGDHSPIDERLAAAIGGLGILGENGLLINERYGSFCNRP